MDNIVFDSLVFLSCARSTLKEFVQASNLDGSEDLANYLTNEASDYEIMYSLVHEELPTKKFDPVGEQKIFREFNKLTGFTQFTPISELGLSSAKPILEFQMASNSVMSLIREVDIAALKRQLAFAKDEVNNAETAAGADDAQGWVKDLQDKIKKAEAAAKTTADAGADAADAASGAGSAVKKAAGDLGKRVAMRKGTSAAIASEPGQKIIKATGIDKGAAAVGQASDKVSNAVATGVDATKQAAGQGAEAAKKGLAGAMAGLQQKATTVGAAITGNPILMGAGAAVIVALAAYGAYKTYQRFFSQAAKSCSGKGGKEKTMCIIQFQQKAMQAQYADLNKGMAGCAKSKDPAKCKAGIQQKGMKIKNKIAKLQAKAAKVSG